MRIILPVPEIRVLSVEGILVGVHALIGYTHRFEDILLLAAGDIK